MLKRILAIAGALVVAFLIVVSMQPATFSLSRSTTISAPAEAVFPLVNDFHKWDAWSPWAKLDPAMKATFDGPATGPGAIYTWEGNSTVGQGKMTIASSHPSDSVTIDLEFIKPFAAKNKTEFTFKTTDKQTTVTWNMSGENNFIAKAMCLFISMDKMVGGDFEKGLAQLKAAAEAGLKK
jgi:hypothetical protein